MKIESLVFENETFKLNGYLDLDNRQLTLDYPSEINDTTIFSSIFKNDIPYLKGHPNINLVVRNSKEETFYLQNCPVAFTLSSSGISNFRFGKADYVLSNSLSSTEELKVEKFIAKHTINTKSSFLLNYQPFYTSFDDFQIEIKRSERKDDLNRTLPPYLIISIRSSNSTYNSFFDIYHLLLDVLTIILGKTPVYISTELVTQNNVSNLYHKLIDKYTNHETSQDYAISTLDETTLDESILKKVHNFKMNRTKLFNIFILHLNCQSYVELSLSGLLQTTEGLYKNTEHINLNNGKKHNYQIYNYLFNLHSTQEILSDDDKVIVIQEKLEKRQFLLYMVDIRNFFTHYSQKNNSRLSGITYYYIFKKVSLASRIMMFETFGGITNKKLIQKSTIYVNEFSPSAGLQYKYDKECR